MKILFICRGNVMRSQVAEAYFNSKTEEHKAVSAGTQTERYQGRKLRDFAHNTVACMQEIGLEISDSEPKPLTPEMVEKADRIYVMAEKETWPDYLKTSDKVEFWDIEDPRAGGYDAHAIARDDVIRHVDSELEKMAD